MREQFLREGLLDVSMDAVDNVYGRLPGNRGQQALDRFCTSGYGFPRETRISNCHGKQIECMVRASGTTHWAWPLYSDCYGRCENTASTRDGDIWFVANVCEEGLGNLRGMKAVVDRFGADVRAYLVIEGTALAHVYHRAIAVQRYRVTVRTAGGHSWSDYGQPSAIHELARLITEMTGLVSYRRIRARV